MKVEFTENFLKDIKAVKDKSVLAKVKATIETVEQADSPDKIPDLKKIRGTREYFRIRIGDFRVGLMLERGTLIFIRFLNRRDIYRYFP